MCLLATSFSHVGQAALVGVLMLLAVGQLLFPSRARTVYLAMKGLRGIAVDRSSSMLSDFVLRFYALGTILALIIMGATIFTK